VATGSIILPAAIVFYFFIINKTQLLFFKLLKEKKCTPVVQLSNNTHKYLKHIYAFSKK